MITFVELLIDIGCVILICMFIRDGIWNTIYAIKEARIKKNLKDDYFEIVGEDQHFSLAREKRTDIMYAILDTDVTNGAVSMTVMLGADGKPLLYSDWVKIECKE